MPKGDMKLTSKIQIDLRGKILGGKDVLTCVPLLPRNRKEMMEILPEIVREKPDILEWRVDFYEEADNPVEIGDVLQEMAIFRKEIPLIFTFRHVREGGAKSFSSQARLSTIQAAVESGEVDLVDIELDNDPVFLQRIKSMMKKRHIPLILSFHDFHKTPDEERILEKFKEERRMGADVLKIAVMPNSFEDVLMLMKATLNARKELPDQPMIAISMGKWGKISRMISGLYGSDMTFVQGNEASAPGQIPLKIFKEVQNYID